MKPFTFVLPEWSGGYFAHAKREGFRRPLPGRRAFTLE
jgi:hypothetical protein